MTDQATRWNGEQTEALDAEEELSAATARLDIQRASNDVVGVVPFAVSLCFAGMSSKLSAARLRHVTIAVGCVVFVGSAICIATFPVSVAV